MWGGDACVYKGDGMCGVMMHVCKGGVLCGVVMHVCIRVMECVGW